MMGSEGNVKKIDLEVIVETQVLCEFYNGHGRGKHKFEGNGFLTKIRDIHYKYFRDGVEFHAGVRICQDKWIANPDGKLVLPDGLLVVGRHNQKGSDFQGMTTGRLIKDAAPYVSQILPMDLEKCHSVKVTGLADGWEY